MKPSIKQTILLAMATAAISPLAYAATPGYEQTVTMTMAVYSTAPGTYVRDPDGGAFVTPKEATDKNAWSKGTTDYTEDIAKITTMKIGNKEILTELVEADVIPGPITGWSIKIISDEYGDQEGMFLVKKDADPVYIGDYLHTWPQANAESYKFTSTDSTSSYKETGSGNEISLMKAILDTDGYSYEFNLHGMLTESFKYVQGTSTDWDGAWLSNGATYKLIGSLDFPNTDKEVSTLDGYDHSSVVEGTWKMTSSKAVADIDAYLDLLEY